MSGRSVVFTAAVTKENVNETHIALASKLADISGDICCRHFGKKIEIVDKEDGSPVSKADLEVEHAIREAILSRFPDHSIFGEEYGLTIGSGDDKRYLWVIDPIDGTLSFITGIIDQPILKDRWIGVKGKPTLHNGQPVTTRACKDAAEAYMYSVSPDMFTHHKGIAFHHLSSQVKHHIWGGDSYAYGLLANGLVDIVFDANMKVFDYMALVPIVQGAGGMITDWSGKDLIWDGVRLNGAEQWQEESLASATPELHKRALELIGWRASVIPNEQSSQLTK